MLVLFWVWKNTHHTLNSWLLHSLCIDLLNYINPNRTQLPKQDYATWQTASKWKTKKTHPLSTWQGSTHAKLGLKPPPPPTWLPAASAAPRALRAERGLALVKEPNGGPEKDKESLLLFSEASPEAQMTVWIFFFMRAKSMKSEEVSSGA